jgi:lipoyl(octanoyl) transferase
MIQIKKLGLQSYESVWENMRSFTTTRTPTTSDELWMLEHFPVYTQGQAGKPEHLLNPTAIPVVQSDRGGQITFHGPGQLVAYVLMDLKRRKLGIRDLVKQLEETLISVLSIYHISATRKCSAPGVYVNDKKIASIGLRVKNGCTYHGIALNVNNDLTPFSNINPCGFKSLEMTKISHFDNSIQMEDIVHQYENALLSQFRQ